jgi:hypothetical protein
MAAPSVPDAPVTSAVFLSDAMGNHLNGLKTMMFTPQREL